MIIKYCVNRMFKLSPCNTCLINSICVNGCKQFDDWLSKTYYKLQRYKFISKIIMILLFILSCTFLVNINFLFNNPISLAILLCFIFIPFPFYEIHILTFFRYYYSKNRLNKKFTNILKEI